MVNPVMAMFRRPAQRRRRRSALEIIASAGVREESFRTVGGIPQWVTVRGHDKANQVLLIIHGGPGSPYTPFNSWLSEWEQSFTVVQWDQRGAGPTFIRSGAPDLSLQQIVADGLELAESLLRTIGAMMAGSAADSCSAVALSDILGPDSGARSWVQTLDTARITRHQRAVRKPAQLGSDPRAWNPQQAPTQSKIAVQVSSGAPN